MQPAHGAEPAPKGPAFSVIVADEDAAARELAEVLRRDPRIELLQVASSAGETLASVEALRPDLVLVGDLPDTDLGELMSGIAGIGTTAVILLVHPDRVQALPPALRMAGFLRREGTAEEILQGFFEIAFLATRLRGEPDETDRPA